MWCDLDCMIRLQCTALVWRRNVGGFLFYCVRVLDASTDVVRLGLAQEQTEDHSLEYLLDIISDDDAEDGRIVGKIADGELSR